MNHQIEKLLDRIGRNILTELQENARIPFSRLGRKVGLSAPAVAERVKKLEEAGVIRGYHARIDPDRLGQPILAFIQLTADPRQYPAVKAAATQMPAIRACHHISGEAAFILHVRVADLPDLEALVAQLSRFGQTRSAIVLSTTVDKTALPLPG